MSSKFLISASSQVEISDVVGLQDELDEIQEEIASGGGGISYDAGSVVQGNGLNFRNGTDTDKIKNAAGFALVNLIGIGDSLLVNDITFPTINSTETTINDNKRKLTQVTYDDTDPQKPITLIQGELDVNKIKNAPHTAEIEFENTGNLRISCDDDIILNATNSHIGLGSSLDTNSIELSALNEVLIRTHGLGITDDVVLDSGNHVQFTPSKDLISASGRNTIITSSNGFISLTANNGGVLINTIPTLPNSVATKAYVDSKATFRKTIQTSIDNTSIYEDTYIKIGWDAPGNDVEVTILQQPTTAGVSIFSITKNYVASSSPSSEIYLTQINQKTDIYDVGLTPGNTLRFSIAAANDYSNTYPVYNVLVYNGGPATSFVVNKA
jgi:hypothetical protein